MLRFLLILVLVFLALRFLTRVAAAVLQAIAAGGSGLPARGGRNAAGSIPLARCSACGSYVPQPQLRGSGERARCARCAGG